MHTAAVVDASQKIDVLPSSIMLHDLQGSDAESDVYAATFSGDGPWSGCLVRGVLRGCSAAAVVLAHFSARQLSVRRFRRDRWTQFELTELGGLAKMMRCVAEFAVGAHEHTCGQLWRGFFASADSRARFCFAV